MTIRKATVDDIDELIQLRIDFLELLNDGQPLPPAEKDTIIAQLRTYFANHLPLGNFVAIVAKTGENWQKTASAGFMIISERPANRSFITGITATVLNVITYPAFRRQGCAKAVLEALIAEAKKANVSAIDLAATEQGITLYRKLGFTPHPETYMRLRL